MYNTDLPKREDLPTTRQLVRSTLIAALSALVILVTIVLPSEYAIDPTGIGKALGLAEMGEIKQQLKEENENHSSSFFFGSAHAASHANIWKDELSIELVPGEGAEIKLTMKEGAVASFEWSVAHNGRANFDLHGHAPGQSITYEKGRGVPGKAGDLVADFDGSHGWFWRNRSKETITILLKVRGDYSALINN